MVPRRSLTLLGALLLLARSSAASCFDGVRDGRESDIDCGGDCPACEPGDRCWFPSDCESGRCADSVCQERAYEPGAPVPRGYRVENAEGDGAAVVRTIGWVSLGLGYGAAYVAALSRPGDLSWLYAPVVGPWVVVGKPGQTLRGLLVLDGLLQTVGAGLVVGGIATSGKQLVHDAPAAGDVRVSPVVTGTGGGGLCVHGVF